VNSHEVFGKIQNSHVIMTKSLGYFPNLFPAFRYNLFVFEKKQKGFPLQSGVNLQLLGILQTFGLFSFKVFEFSKVFNFKIPIPNYQSLLPFG